MLVDTLKPGHQLGTTHGDRRTRQAGHWRDWGNHQDLVERLKSPTQTDSVPERIATAEEVIGR
jgi:hypothetical protein